MAFALLDSWTIITLFVVPFLFSIRSSKNHSLCNSMSRLSWIGNDLTINLFSQVIDEYQKSFGETWRSAKEDSAQPWPYLADALTKFQVYSFFLCNFILSWNLSINTGGINSIRWIRKNPTLLIPHELWLLVTHLVLSVSALCDLQDPAEADKLLKIQRELDETKIILVSCAGSLSSLFSYVSANSD